MSLASQGRDVPSRGRVLLIGPVFPIDSVGGLQLALREVLHQLTLRGWYVQAPIYEPPRGATAADTGLRATYGPSLLSAVPHRHWTRRLALRLPARVRSWLRLVSMPPGYFKIASGDLEWIEARLTSGDPFDIVIVCTDGCPPGLAALASDLHPCVVVLSLPGLSLELARSWLGLRLLSRYHLRGLGHPYLFRAIRPERIRTAVFASRQWAEDAIRAGLSRDRARVIYFGIPLPEPRRAPPKGSRILWVGRLSREKGLHVLLDALPQLRLHVPEVSVTAIGAESHPGYQQEVRRTVEALGLGQSVKLLPAVAHAALQDAYAEHDILFFYSEFAEPVALVLMEAFAAGLPVVSSRASRPGGLVQDEVTCLCYRPDEPDSVVTAIVRLLTCDDLRQRLADAARRLVCRDYSAEAMGYEYDHLLRGLLGAR